MKMPTWEDDMESVFGGEGADILDVMGLSLTSWDVEADDLDISVFSSYDSDSDGECVGGRSHDCMWGGQCCSRERLQAKPPPPPAANPVFITNSSHKVVTIQKCASDRTDNVVVVTNNSPAHTHTPAPLRTKNERSLLLNRTNLPSPPKPPARPQTLTPQSSRPETPQSLSSDDDFTPIPLPLDAANTTSIFHSAVDAISSSGELDLLWGGRRTKDAAPQSAATPQLLHTNPLDIQRISASAKSDHCYDGSAKSLRLEGLGVDTPSDSEEEEIDVVSLSERSSSRSSSCGGLPTRPTARDQEHLEEITTSLLSASEAVSRRLQKTLTTGPGKQKRKKHYQPSESSDDEDDDDDDEEDDDNVYAGTHVPRYHQRAPKRYKTGGASSRRKKSQKFSGDEELLSQDKRDLHNNMERMRRIDLRNSFEELKALVPSLAAKDRAAKVVILREAANYCCDLGADSQSKCMQVMALRKEQERLRSIVSSMRKAAAMAKQRY